MAGFSLKYRIALVAFLLQLAMFSHLLWQTYSVTRDAELKQLQVREEVFLELLGKVSRNALLISEYSEFQNLVLSFTADPHINQIILMDQHGRVVASNDMHELGTSRPAMDLTPQMAWRSCELSNATERLGILAVRYSRAGFHQGQRAMLMRGIPIAVGGILLSAVVGLGLGSIMTRRLAALERAAQSLGQGASGVTVTIPGNDEISRLSHIFNEMSASLDRQFTKLRQAATVFESSSEVVIITDLQGIIQSVNDAFTRVLGYQPEEAIGRNPSFLKSGRHDTAFFEEMWRSIISEGIWQGEIWNRRKDAEIFPAWLTIKTVYDGEGRPTHYVGVIADISVIKRSQEELEHLAHHDPLTGLPNRLLFDALVIHALDGARREQSQAALLVLDLDRFKNINDSYGHQLGDTILRTVADRLQQVLRDQYMLARLGGDEFCVLIEQLEDEQQAANVATMIQEALAAPIAAGNREFYLSASIGICLFPQDGADPAKLLRNADTAMYRAKEAGGGFQFYAPDHTSRIRERLTLEASLRKAIERGELRLNYQPQVSLATGEVTGVEALARWTSPEFGLVPPGKFIPIAEESGLIMPLGEWVLEDACHQMRRWCDQGIAIPRMAVNLSALQIERSDIVGLVRRVLDKSGLTPDRLELEITEGYILQQTELAITTLKQLRDLGVTIAIDDFGTGFSSLSYLHRLPIDRLKIDRSFVHEIGSGSRAAQVAQAIISLGQALGLAIIGEGVEQPVHAETLRGWGCQEGQGFLYSPAVEPTVLELFSSTKGVRR